VTLQINADEVFGKRYADDTPAPLLGSPTTNLVYGQCASGFASDLEQLFAVRQVTTIRPGDLLDQNSQNIVRIFPILDPSLNGSEHLRQHLR